MSFIFISWYRLPSALVQYEWCLLLSARQECGNVHVLINRVVNGSLNKNEVTSRFLQATWNIGACCTI